MCEWCDYLLEKYNKRRRKVLKSQDTLHSWVKLVKSWDTLHTFTWLLGKADVRRVSWVSSESFRLGMLNIKAAWSGVAAVEVILNPFPHRRWIPSLG